MISVRNMLSLTLFMALFASTVAQLEIMPKSLLVLQNFGEAEGTFTVMAPGGESSIAVSDSTLFTVGEITSVPAEGGFTNYSIPLTMESGVGTDDITVTIGTESVTGSVIVAGIVIKDDGKIVSGDNGAGVTVGIENTFSFEVEAVGTDGQSVDVSGATITGMATSGTYMKQLDTATTKLSSTVFTLGIAKFRTSETPFKVSFDVPAIQANGESFETILKVMQSPTTAPCVAIGGTYTSVNGVVKIDMYNVADDTEVSISVGSTSGTYNAGESTLTMPDQVIAFDFATGGSATITCDGSEAYTTGPITIEVESTTEELAKDFVFEVAEVEGKDQLTVRLSVTDSSPSTLTKAEGDKIVDEFCKICGVERGPSSCEAESIKAGSAIVEMAANVDNGEEKEVDVKSSVEKCTFTENIGQNCDYLELLQSTVNAVGGVSVATGAGLATWTIVLIAGLGAFALIVLIMLGLLAVYRRSAEQSESDYSSSGPLGVPDPSDLLYEQSIVRDIYGRGDFPDGGPTAAVAEQREREAALREEFPRPPSSSGLSRGSGTDDASSTYSV